MRRDRVAASVPSSDTRSSSEKRAACDSAASHATRRSVSSVPFVRTVTGASASVSSTIASISGWRNGSPPVR